uniref:Uncharacterized protein n=1 Tax=Glossina pallidipes TaxID=7398 RepID=A0A1A9Z1M1_GLOPL
MKGKAPVSGKSFRSKQVNLVTKSRTMSYTRRLTIRLNEVHETVRSLDIEDLVAELRVQDYENHPKESGEIFCAVCLSDFQCDEIIMPRCKFMKRVTCGINSDKQTQSESVDRSSESLPENTSIAQTKRETECTEDECQEAQFYLYISGLLCPPMKKVRLPYPSLNLCVRQKMLVR